MEEQLAAEMEPDSSEQIVGKIVVGVIAIVKVIVIVERDDGSWSSELFVIHFPR